MTDIKPKLNASERAARDLLNRKVREGVINRQQANQVLKAGLPFVQHMLAEWRREGTDPQWLTDKFQSIHADAKQKRAVATSSVAQHMALTRVVCAEMYLAVWAGMQADMAAYVNARRTTPELSA